MKNQQDPRQQDRSKQTRSEQTKSDKAAEKQTNSQPIPPWPDQKAREEMSDAEVTRQSLGKHSKNRDWEDTW